MGLLDDLKAQAEQKNKPDGEQPAAPGAEEFYRAQVKQRMIMAKDFFTQLYNQLNEMNLVIQAKYPLLPEAKILTLQQQGYKAYSDDIPNPRQVTFGFNCVLTSPTTYDIRGRGPATAQGELLDRYQFKYVKLEARDQNQTVIGARFKLEGPLPVKCVLQFDEAKLIIKLLLTNFIGPGTSQYNLNPDQLNEAFLDHLGNYLLRKEAKLFQEEISDDVKAMLRKKMQQEQLQREAELRAAEEQLKAEELARKQNSTKEQLKQAVSQSVAENSEKLKKLMDEQVREKGEKLKSMFSKLINRAGSETAAEQSPEAPADNSRQTAKPTGNPAVQGQPPVNRQAGQTASAQQTAVRPTPSAEQKKPTPPKVFVSSASNPFLKPQDFEPVPMSDEAQTQVAADTQNPAAPLPAQSATPATAKPPTPTMSPAAAQARPAAQPNASVAKPVNPVPPTKTAAVQTEIKKPAAPSTDHTATPTTQSLRRASAAVQAKPVAETTASVAKPVNPVPPTKSPAAQTETKKPMAPAQSATPAMTTPSPAAKATPAATPNASVATATDSSVQTKPPAAPIELELSLEPIASESASSSPTTPAETKIPTTPSSAQTATPTTTHSPVTKATPVAAPTAPVATPARTATPTKPPAAPKEPEGLELELVMEPIVPNSKPSSPAVLAETEKPTAPAPVQTSTPATPASKRSPQSTAPDSKSASMVTKPKSSSEVSSLSLEDQLERDLARFMENDQPPPSSAVESADDPSSTSAELDFDLSAPGALEIHFEDTDKTSKQKNSEPKK